jgi:deoxyribodipyrimidine photo-lyase
MSGASLVWFRQDLRLQDKPALEASVLCGAPVIPIYLWAPEEEGRWPLGAASRWWLRLSLEKLDRSLRRIGSRLIVRRGASLASLLQLRAETGAEAVFWNRRYEPMAVQRDQDIERSLRQ